MAEGVGTAENVLSARGCCLAKSVAILREHLKIQVEQVGIQNTVFGEGAVPAGERRSQSLSSSV